jgi:uroporphyrinogen-III synthase
MSSKTKPQKRILVPWVGESQPEWLQTCPVDATFLSLPLCRFEHKHSKQTAQDIFSEIARYEWGIFLDAPSVQAFFEVFFQHFDDARCLGGLRIACLGKAAAEAVRGFRYAVDVEVETAIAQVLIDTDSLDNAKVLIISGNDDEQALIESLEKGGMAIVDRFPVYQKKWTALKSNRVAKDFRENGAHAILFPDVVSVEAFMHQAAALKGTNTALLPKSIAWGNEVANAMRKQKIPVSSVIEGHCPDWASLL